ncbi:glycosyltransferase [Halomicroarcula sp. F13]|uniref:Glycosyltransferase n=1 Tax=Haloarcula rubra TaxID=2487747 RepID=A0AAW4PXK0_9EURY|nr:glycosyltransferase [Halomicroarcula rubra]MBX0325909.1 glycosyltransferase [Halomicroarcula rubra]
MNILQVNKFYYPKVGGIEHVVQNIAEGLSDQHTTRVLSARPKGWGRSEQHNGVDVRKTSSIGVAMSVPLAPTFPIHLRTSAQNTDIIHHHLPNPLSTVSQLTAGTGDSAVIATYHSDIVRQATALKIYKPVLQQFLSRVDRILVTSKPLLENSSILEPYKKKCDIVPLSIDLDVIDAEDPPPLDIDTTDPIILFVGRLNYYKGVEHLIDAMDSIEATLLVAGDGERRSVLKRRARNRGVNNRIQFVGYVSDQKLASLYRAADLFVLPSVEPSEAFGIVQLEAMARELPVVNTSLPTGVPWVSQDGQTGLTVPPRNAEALADAVNTLLEDDARRRSYGEQARKRVERLFTRGRMLKKIQEVYEEVG